MQTQKLAITPEVREDDAASFWMPSPDLSRVSELLLGDTQEVLDFLSIRPVHTVVMTSFINDNGIASELNRGKFYGYRNADGEIEGVALIGHSTLVEARSAKLSGYWHSPPERAKHRST